MKPRDATHSDAHPLRGQIRMQPLGIRHLPRVWTAWSSISNRTPGCARCEGFEAPAGMRTSGPHLHPGTASPVSIFYRPIGSVWSQSMLHSCAGQKGGENRLKTIGSIALC